MFGRKKTAVRPAQGKAAVEVSACTGETLIGLRGEDGKLHESVVVRSKKDAEEFCRAHGIPLTGELLRQIPAKYRE